MTPSVLVVCLLGSGLEIGQRITILHWGDV